VLKKQTQPSGIKKKRKKKKKTTRKEVFTPISSTLLLSLHEQDEL
jgi:hypothetical protein